MIDLKPIVHRILEDYALPWHGTHGVGHWARVLENGLRLASRDGCQYRSCMTLRYFPRLPPDQRRHR